MTVQCIRLKEVEQQSAWSQAQIKQGVYAAKGLSFASSQVDVSCKKIS